MALSAVTKRYSFRAVHSLTEGEHREKFHGHQYFLEVSFQRASLSEVDSTVQEKILEVLDGHDLTSRIAPATGEVIVEWIHRELENSPLRGKLLGVTLQETRKNRFVSAKSIAHLI
jgi:6-pyruvoyl-tetrahydropterin synthase